MRTATLDDLQNRLSTVMSWVEAGEDVMVKANPSAAEDSERVDWSTSVVFRRSPSEDAPLSQEEPAEWFDDMRGPS